MRGRHRNAWRTAAFDYAPHQSAQGTCLVLAAAMNTTYEWRVRPSGAIVYRFTFYQGSQDVYDIDTGKRTVRAGTPVKVRWADRDDITGFAPGVWGDLEYAYANTFGADTLRGDYPQNTMARFGKPLDEVHNLATETRLDAELARGELVIFVSDSDTLSPWFKKRHAYRVLPAGDDTYHFINPWSRDGAYDGHFILNKQQMLQGGEAWGSFYSS